MDDALRRKQAALIRRHLGKRGIHGLKIDEHTHAVEIYVDENADLDRAVISVRKDSGDLDVRARKSRKARLA